MYERIQTFMNTYKYLTSVAGVSFSNEDGTERQQAIKDICHGDTKNEYRFIATLRPATYTDPSTNVTENAIAVYAGYVQIGFIPRDSIEQMRGIESVVAIASYYGVAEKYTVNLYEHETPSAKQYSYVKRICNENNWRLPLYTRQEYTRFITAYDNSK